jgi:hypothetical protein
MQRSSHMRDTAIAAMCLVAQLELSGRLERERLELSLQEAAAAKQRLSDQLASTKQVRPC